MDVVDKIRNNDPALRGGEGGVWSDGDFEESNDGDQEVGQKQKKVTHKDVTREKILSELAKREQAGSDSEMDSHSSSSAEYDQTKIFTKKDGKATIAEEETRARKNLIEAGRKK